MLTTYEYDSCNRLKTAATDGGDITTYTHDAAGNRTKIEKPGGDTTYYDYDSLSRMVRAEPGSGAVTFTYNAGSQRVSKETPNGAVTGYLYDHKRLLQETDGVGGEVDMTYASATEEEYGDLISQDGDGGSLHHQFDAQKNTVALADPQGDVVARFNYHAFGEVASVSIIGDAWSSLTADQWEAMTPDVWETLPVEITTNLAMGGRKGYYRDEEIELYLMGMGGGGVTGNGTRGRYYDPVTGRFTSEDPIRHASGDANLQRYVGNDPINNVDPSGTAGESEAAARGRVVGAAIERAVLSANPGIANRNQAPVVRNYEGIEQAGKADLAIQGQHSEIGPASATGVPAKNYQMGGLPEHMQDSVYLYNQTSSIPTLRESIEYARLTAEQARQLGSEVRSMKAATNNEIFARAKEIAGLENCASVKITEADISQAGRYFRGVKINVLNCIGVIGFILTVKQGLEFQKNGNIIDTYSREQTLEEMRKEAKKDRPSVTTIRENEVLFFEDEGGKYSVLRESPRFPFNLMGDPDRWYKIYVSGEIYDRFRFDPTGTSPTRIEVFGEDLKVLKKQVEDEIEWRTRELERLQRRHPYMPVYLGMDKVI